MEIIIALHMYIWGHTANNQEPAILRQIQHVSFPNLQKIYLSGNGIESIEVLARTDLPAIISLSICKQQLT